MNSIVGLEHVILPGRNIGLRGLINPLRDSYLVDLQQVEALLIKYVTF